MGGAEACVAPEARRRIPWLSFRFATAATAVSWASLLIAALLLLVSAAVLWQAAGWGREAALAELRRDADASLALRAAALRSELEKFRALALVLAEDADVAALLRNPSDRARVDLVNRKLATVAEGTRAPVLYVVDAAGLALAASNWHLATSFVGQDYAFRSYVRAALANGSGEQFASGTVSQRPGYFVARRTEASGGPVGVVVVKVEFDRLEAEWRQGRGHSFVVDANGMVLIADEPEWRFNSLGTLPEAVRARLRDEMQYGATTPLTPLPLTRPGGAAPDNGIVTLHRPGAGVAPESFLEVVASVPDTGWTIHGLEPLAPEVGRRMLSAVLAAGLLLVAVIAATGLILYRRRRLGRELEAQARARAELERRVDERTRELRASNALLGAEVEERLRAEAELRQTQGELVHAAKLAALGQMAASIAHEVNQPLAALRSFSDNAAVFLARGQPEAVEANLTEISSLTGRIADITRELKGFARKASGRLGPVSVRAALDTSIGLVELRLRERGIRVTRQLPAPDVQVVAEQVRLEQVLVNLVQNAIDALAATAAPEITVTVQRRDARVAIIVADNGPGIAAADASRIFAAFYTTKESGLGLGLSISRGIVQDFGGSLTCRAAPQGGASFIVELRMAA